MPSKSFLFRVNNSPAFKIVVAAIADHDTLEPRIYSLVNKPYIRRQFRILNLLITLFSSVVLATILVIPVHAKEFHHEEHDVVMVCSVGEECMQSCTTQENMDKLYSEIPNSRKIHIENSSHPYTSAQ